MKKVPLLALAALVCGVLSAEYLEIAPTETRSYKVGEPVTFTVTGWADKTAKMTSGTVRISLRDSGWSGAKIADDVVIDFAKGNPATFTVALNRPGFILVSPAPRKSADGKKIEWMTRDRAKPALGGAAVEPEKIRPGAECPADFDEFWRKNLELFKKAEIVLSDDVPAAQRRRGYKVSRITVKFPGGTGMIDGFLLIPEKPGKYPAMAGVPGAGPGWVRSSGGRIPIGRPTIELWLNVHPFPTAATIEEQKARAFEYRQKHLNNTGYWLYRAENRDEYIYRNVWSAVSRAIDYVAELPEFDGKNFAILGHSQGGGSALAVGSLNPHITCIMASVPALCDHGGWKLGRQEGWPMIHTRLKGKADAASGYFDGANFAARIKVPTVVSAGYVDLTCSPASVYAAYNMIRAPKTMVPLYHHGHYLHPDYRQKAEECMRKTFGK